VKTRPRQDGMSEKELWLRFWICMALVMIFFLLLPL